jgi:hypothetical protein
MRAPVWHHRRIPSDQESAMAIRPRWLLMLSLLACVACKPNQPEAVATTPAGQPAVAAPSGDTPRATPDSGFVLTMDKVDAYYATIAKLSTMAGSDDDADDVTAMDADESVDQYIARIQADPKAAALITSAGMSVSDYAHTNEAMLAGTMTAGALESGALKKIPDGVNPQYVEFVQAHKAQLAAKIAALQKQFGG